MLPRISSFRCHLAQDLRAALRVAQDNVDVGVIILCGQSSASTPASATSLSSFLWKRTNSITCLMCQSACTSSLKNLHLLPPCRPRVHTGQGPNAFCSGGDQSLRGEGGYDDGSDEVPRLRVLDLQVWRPSFLATAVLVIWSDVTFSVLTLDCPSPAQVEMRRCPKPIIAMIAGYAVGGGHILHMVNCLLPSFSSFFSSSSFSSSLTPS